LILFVRSPVVILLFKVRAALLGAMNTDFIKPSLPVGMLSFTWGNEAIVGEVIPNPAKDTCSLSTNKMLSSKLAVAKVAAIPVLNVNAYAVYTFTDPAGKDIVPPVELVVAEVLTMYI